MKFQKKKKVIEELRKMMKNFTLNLRNIETLCNFKIDFNNVNGKTLKL